MRWSVSVVAEGDRVVSLEEIVELADAVAGLGGIVAGAGSMSYGAQIVIEADSADEAVERAVPAFADAAATAALPPWPVARVEVVGELDREDLE